MKKSTKKSSSPNQDVHSLQCLKNKKIFSRNELHFFTLFHQKIEFSFFFHLNLEILEKLFNLIYYPILTL